MWELITLLASTPIILIGIIWLLYDKKNFFVISLAIGELTIYILKNIFKVPRPTTILTDYSFPSGHSFFVVLFWGIIIYLYTNKKWYWWLSLTFLSLIVGYSRLALNVHYVYDIIAGLFLGTIFLLSTLLLHRQFFHKV